VGGQRTGALIGQVFEASVPTEISSVSVVNPIPELNDDGSLKDEANSYYIKANGNRASALVAFIQPSSVMTGDLEVRISNCYTQTYVWSTGYSVGGIVGEYDDSKAVSEKDSNFVLDIANCYTSSVLVSTGTGRVGGMLAYHKGGSAVNVTRCLSTITMYYKGLKVTAAQKNLSGIIGNGATGYTSVSQCIALIEEYNSDYGVTARGEKEFSGKYGKGIFENTLKFDSSVWNYLANSEGNLQSPYVELIFQNCNCQ